MGKNSLYTTLCILFLKNKKKNKNKLFFILDKKLFYIFHHLNKSQEKILKKSTYS